MDIVRADINDKIWDSLFPRFICWCTACCAVAGLRFLPDDVTKSLALLGMLAVLIDWVSDYAALERRLAYDRFKQRHPDFLYDLDRMYCRLERIEKSIELMQETFEDMKQFTKNRRLLISFQNKCYRKRSLYLEIIKVYRGMREVCRCYHGIDIREFIAPDFEPIDMPTLRVS